jgi:hypothetical protein
MTPRSRGEDNARAIEKTTLEKQRAQGKPGAQLHPQPRMQSLEKHTSIVTTGSPKQSGLPCAMVLTAYFVLSPATGLFCHRRLQATACKLDASVGASGPHDFAVRLIAARQRAVKASIASRTQRS